MTTFHYAAKAGPLQRIEGTMQGDSTSGVARSLMARGLFPVEVTEACLARAEATEPKLNAFSNLMPEKALAAARARAGRSRSRCANCDVGGRGRSGARYRGLRAR